MPVKACCNGRVQRILQQRTERSVTPEITLPCENEAEESQGVSEANGPVLDSFRVQAAVSSAWLAPSLLYILFSQPWGAVDSEMCKTAHQGAMGLPDRLSAVLQGTVKLSTFYPFSALSSRLNGSCQVK